MGYDFLQAATSPRSRALGAARYPLPPEAAPLQPKVPPACYEARKHSPHPAELGSLRSCTGSSLKPQLPALRPPPQLFLPLPREQRLTRALLNAAMTSVASAPHLRLTWHAAQPSPAQPPAQPLTTRDWIERGR